MKFKLMRTLIITVAVGLFISPAHAQTVKVEVPNVKVKVPGINVELPDININIPDINIDVPQIDFDEGDVTEREELHQTYQLSSGARVELSNIHGPIDIETTNSDTAEVLIFRYALNDAELNSHKLIVAHTPTSLSVRGEANNVREGQRPVRHHLMLKLPSRVDLTINNTTDRLRVGELNGPIHLDGVSGQASVLQAVGSAEISHVSGTVMVIIAQLGERGARVSGVSGKVELRFPDNLNADLQTNDIKGKVYVEVPNVAVEGKLSRADFRARIGAGGAPLIVSDVVGTVRLTRAASVGEMVEILKSSGNSLSRMNIVRDLALHVSNKTARQALVEALLGNQNSIVQMTAAKALVPYVNEPEVREAFIKALDVNSNSVVRMTVVKALAKNFAGDKSARDMLLKVFRSDQNDMVRMTIIGSLTKYLDDPAVLRVMIDALRNDPKDIVRMRASRALRDKAGVGEVYELMLEVAKRDRSKIVRAHALDALSMRIKERPELRDLFLGFLDDESLLLQYHALQGLVELADPQLQPRLVEKSKNIIMSEKQRNWNSQMVLDTLILLRKLDPREADKVLEQLSIEKSRSY